MDVYVWKTRNWWALTLGLMNIVGCGVGRESNKSKPALDKGIIIKRFVDLNTLDTMAGAFANFVKYGAATFVFYQFLANVHPAFVEYLDSHKPTPKELEMREKILEVSTSPIWGKGSPRWANAQFSWSTCQAALRHQSHSQCASQLIISYCLLCSNLSSASHIAPHIYYRNKRNCKRSDYQEMIAIVTLEWKQSLPFALFVK